MDAKQEQLLKTFKRELVEQFVSPKVLTVLREDPSHTHSDSPTFSELKRWFPPLFTSDEGEKIEFFMNSKFDNGPFDLIFGDIPLGLRSSHPHINEPQTPNMSWNLIHRFAQMLSESGLGFFLMTPRGFDTRVGDDFLEFLRSQDIHVVGYLKLPDSLYESLSSLKPILMIVSRQFQKVRIGELDSIHSIEGLVKEIISPNTQSKYFKSLPDTTRPFRGFVVIEVQDQIHRLESRFKDYKTVPLPDMLVTHNRGRRDHQFEKLPNCLYLKLLSPHSTIFTDVETLTGKVENYVQLVLKEEYLNEYLKVYFESRLGQLVLKSLSNDGYLNRLNIRDLLEMTTIPVPSISIQSKIVETHKRFSLLEEQVSILKSEISLNPESLSVLSKVDSILEITESLTEGDKIKSLVLQGESKSLEFKQTFELCLRQKTKQKYVEDSCLKTIVGFLNSDGGILLIGVEDSGMIPGIDEERSMFHKDSNDKYLLYLKDKIKNRIGTPFFRYIDTTTVDVDGKTVIEVVCKPSDEEVFLDEKEFYIRTSPSTDKLEGKELSSYLKKRFV